MVKPWSISTTVRNPVRVRDFLQVLQEFEGKPFDKKTQEEMQIALIQKRLYRPLILPEDLRGKYEDFSKPLSWSDAKEIFRTQRYEDPPMRGRQSVNPLNKLGLAVAVERLGQVRITPAGKLLLENEHLASDILFHSLLKLQFPNPLSRKDFTAAQGFNIKPFLATLRLFLSLQSVGIPRLTKSEFCLFVPTLISGLQVPFQVDEIVSYRSQTNARVKEEYTRKFIRRFLKREQEGDFSVEKIYSNLLDYGDNIARYFRFTKYFQVLSLSIGQDWEIQIEPTRREESALLTDAITDTAERFNSLESYLDYLGDPTVPRLPWEQPEHKRKVIRALQKELLSQINDQKLATRTYQDLFVDVEKISEINLLNKIEEKIRETINELSRMSLRSKLVLNTNRIRDMKTRLLNLERRTEPEDLERLVFEILVAIDDEERITPNYPTDDMGNPISHAPGNQADIECVYRTMDLLVEVTLDSGRLQWVREGQPVMRHLRDYEDKNSDKAVYCLFLAKRVHNDTYSQFWISVKYEYNGKPQKIIPLNFEQFACILEAVCTCIEKHSEFPHSRLRELFERLLRVEGLNGYDAWRKHLKQELDNWCKEVL